MYRAKHISSLLELREFEKQFDEDYPKFPDWLDEMPLEQWNEEISEYAWSKDNDLDEDDLDYILGDRSEWP